MAYLHAVLDGDADAALRMRCAADRPRDAAVFARAAAADVARVGPIVRIETNLVDPPDGFRPPATPASSQLEIAYRLVTPTGVRPELRTLEVLEDGQWKWCGEESARSAAICSTASQQAALVSAMTAPTGLGLPSSTQPNMILTVDHAITAPPGASGFVEGWTRGWRYEAPGIRGDVGANLVRLTTSQDALTFVQDRIAHACASTATVFAIPGVPGAVGLHQLADAYVGLQVSGEDPMGDLILFAAGRSAVEIIASDTAINTQHLTTIGLARQALTSSTPTGSAA